MLRVQTESMTTASDGPPSLTIVAWRPDLSMITRMRLKADLSPTLMSTHPMMEPRSPTTEPSMISLAREWTDRSLPTLMERLWSRTQ